MLKKIGLPVLALAAGLMAVPHQAQAGVRFGVAVGVPAYTYPAYPYAFPARAYVAPAPVYVAPYAGWFGYHRGWAGRRWR